MAHALGKPDEIAVRSPERQLSYAALADDIEAGAVALRRHDALRGQDAVRGRDVRGDQIVAVDLAEPADTLAAILACDLAGVIPLVCDAAWETPRKAEILDVIRPALHLSTWPPPGAPRPGVPGGGGARASWRRSGADEWGAAAPHDLAWAGFSSGSTGRPRAIVRTRASWTESYPAAVALSGMDETDSVLVPGPLASSLFCFAALHGLATGARVIATGAWSARTARDVVWDADIMHGVPHMIDVMVTELERASGGGQQDSDAASGEGVVAGRAATAGQAAPAGTAGRARRPRMAMVSGAATPEGLRERAARVGVDVVAYYGAVELSFVAVDPDGAGMRPFHGVEIDVRPVDQDSGLGEVWVRSPWVAEGYLAGASGPFRTDDAGWATVGDLADLAPTPAPMIMNTKRLHRSISVHDHRDVERDIGVGELRLRGRGDGAVLTGGATVIPEDVETVLRAVPGISDVAVVGMPHGTLGAVVTAVIEPASESIPRARLEEAAREGLAWAQRPRRWFEVDRMPRTSTGKPARAAISAGLASGDRAVRPLR
ncbi:hypothetical protein EF847_04675 [Actinobacteria bacterium YIM 96077]|uniref:Long-chain fatty acid--CoA ligase n=2 Tax=Phytoactinopolyspora halophila TaxID=1981511 RepID=A0A329R6K3_9ACTN|nr:hypothetical protein EF847_04675 [Actinobacteria bacterium YIM 96077]RAW18658.1 hypothetical protein DPM12_00840 [Phytoactinopolyspora halophila]